MVVEKRKSFGAPGTPSKMAKKQHGKSPGGGGAAFGKSPQQQQPNQQKGKGSPQKQQKQPQSPKQAQTPKQQPQSPEKKVPPPPPAGAKKMEITKNEGKGKNQGKNNKQGKGKGPNNNGALNKVADQSKTINRGRQAKKNRYQRLYTKLDAKPRPVGACERALKAEQELGHSGRVFTVKVADPPLTHEVIKGWSSGIESAVFARPVEARQFFVVFKPTANVKKEVESLKKLSFAGGKLQVEEKVEGDTHLATHPEQIDPFSLYITNIHDSVSKETLAKLFNKSAVVTPPRKHNPKIGSSTKFAFVAFESADDALSAFKEHYNAVLSGNSIVMRFRRSSMKEMAAMKSNEAKSAAVAPSKVEPPTKTEPKNKKGPEPKKAKGPVKTEPESEDEEDENDEEEEDDDEDDEEGAPLGVDMDAVDEDDEDDDDDDDDDVDEDEDDDDDDEDDDE